jgi:ComF family protein
MAFTSFISTIFHSIYHQLLPPSCLLCGYTTQNFCNICTYCQQDLPILPHLCPRCARFISSSSTICGHCLTTPPPFDQTFTLFPYQPPIVQLIIKLKFQHQLEHATAFAELLRKAICTSWYLKRSLPDIIIPVPLHSKRLQERGFNQALEIAKPVSKFLDIPLDKEGIIRSKNTIAQSMLPAKARKENIANAFTVSRNYAGLTIALIDDVVTTGQTITECARVLKQHGAKYIDVWCCARRG